MGERSSGRLFRRRSQPYGRRRSDREPKRGWFPVLVLMLVVAAVDWSTKAMVAATVSLEGFVEVWQGRIAIWHVRNPEMILGLWGNLPIESRQVIATAASILAMLLLYEIVGRGHRLPPHRRPWAWAFAGLAFGGMLGNLGERLLHWGVTDFLSFRWGDVWLPPGNVADLALLLSFPLVVPVILFELKARAQRREFRARGAPANRSVLGTTPSA